jgi:uncharacterized tellurite resistance protein B-like protein
MIRLLRSQLQNKRQQLKKSCENKTALVLADSYNVFNCYYPDAVLLANGEKLPAQQYFEYRNNKTIQWVETILNHSIKACNTDGEYDFQPESIKVTENISKLVIDTVLKIFSYNRDLCDNDYYFISDICNAMGADPEVVGFIIEQSLSETRKKFFGMLVHFLTPEECLKCAILIYRAIKADNYVHPAEFKYFENISQLVRHDHQLLEQLKQRSQSQDIIQLSINEEISKYIFKYLIEIVMCDGQFDSRESEYLKEIGSSFGLDNQQQDDIIQPVASLQMVQASLFPQQKT